MESTYHAKTTFEVMKVSPGLSAAKKSSLKSVKSQKLNIKSEESGSQEQVFNPKSGPTQLQNVGISKGFFDEIIGF